MSLTIDVEPLVDYEISRDMLISCLMFHLAVVVEYHEALSYVSQSCRTQEVGKLRRWNTHLYLGEILLPLTLPQPLAPG